MLDLVEKIYSAALDGAHWPDALAALAELTGGIDATLEIHDKPGRGPAFFVSGDRLPHDGVDDYLRHYASVCPRIPHVASLACGSTSCDYDFISEREMDRSEFYTDFLAPYDLRYFAVGSLFKRAGRLALVAVHRTPRQGHVETADLAVLKRSLPHLGRALDLHLRLRDHDRRETSLRALLDRLPQAVAVLDGRGRLLHANPTARSLLAKEDGVALCKGRIALADTRAARTLAAILGDLLKQDFRAELTAKGGRFAARRPSGKAAYMVTVHALAGATRVFEDDAGCAALFLADPDPDTVAAPDAAILADMFSLTPRETELAIALHRGHRLRDFATRRGVKLTTVRTHLRSLMAKTGTNRQSDLVRILAGIFA